MSEEQRIAELQDEKAELDRLSTDAAERVEDLIQQLDEAEQEEQRLATRYWEVIDELEALGAE